MYLLKVYGEGWKRRSCDDRGDRRRALEVYGTDGEARGWFRCRIYDREVLYPDAMCRGKS